MVMHLAVQALSLTSLQALFKHQRGTKMYCRVHYYTDLCIDITRSAEKGFYNFCVAFVDGDM